MSDTYTDVFEPTPEQHVLDNLPPYHYKLLDYGERPYWSPDGRRIAFVNRNYGDICEIDLETREVRNLTENLGEHHAFLRVLFLPNGDYLLVGPKFFKDRHTSRHLESELWWLDKDASTPPQPIGLIFHEGLGVSRYAPRITYSVNGNHDPSVGGPHNFECRISELEIGSDGVRLGETITFYRVRENFQAEPQDFRHNDSEVIIAESALPGTPMRERYRCTVKGVKVATGEVVTYLEEPGIHNEPEGIFPDDEYICLESASDGAALDVFNRFNARYGNTDLFKLKLDGSGQRARMTQFHQRLPWRCTNSNISPDGRWLAFMVNLHSDEAGFGRGLALLDLHEWEQSPDGQRWVDSSNAAEIP
jgi:hypothetical protein